MTIIDTEEIIPKWFEMEGGGRVQLRTISVADFKAIQKQTVRKKVEYKKVEGTPARFEYEEIDQDLQNTLYWDKVIQSWDEFSFRHPETGEMILCTPKTCTKENKVLLMTRSKKFLEFVVDSLKTLSEDEAARQESEEKN
jgi:hypothetical protein